MHLLHRLARLVRRLGPALHGDGRHPLTEDVTTTLLHAVLESTSDGLLVVNREGRIAAFNRRFLQMWRIPARLASRGDDDTLLEYVLDQLRDPDDFLKRVLRLYDAPAVDGMDLLHFRDGRVYERYSRPHWHGGESVGRIWSFRDITERYRAEQRDRRHALVLDSLRDAVVVTDIEGRVTEWNRGAVEIFGFTREEVLGRKPPFLQRPGVADSFARQIDAALAGTGRWMGEVPFRRKDGTGGAADVLILRQADDAGELVARIAIVSEAQVGQPVAAPEHALEMRDLRELSAGRRTQER